MPDFLAELQMASDASQPERRRHPSGWEPHVEERGNVAHAVSEPVPESNADESDLIRGWQLDPAVWRIVGKVNVRRWQTFDGTWLHYYKADLERIDPEHHADVDALYKRIRGRKGKAVRPTGELTFLMLVGDTQIGKGDGDGSAGTVNRWMGSLDRTVQRLAVLRKSYSVGRVAVAWMGDLGESCTGNYPAQAFTTDLTMREQDSVLQECVFETLARVAPLAEVVDVLTVPGNHGEQRVDGKLYTVPSDNRDVAVVETVHRGIRRNENHAFDHMRFTYPDGQDLTVVADLSGVRCAFAHGHQFGRGSTAPQKADGWWKDQAHGMTPVGDASILFSGHYHHLTVNQAGRKTHIQIPSLDGGSTWWENRTAQCSPPGMVSVLIGDVGPHGCGWDELRVL